MALVALLLVPGSGLALLEAQAPDLGTSPAVAAPARALADRALDHAFLGSFDQLAAVEGAPELAALQPTLESVLRFYALDRDLVLSPPRTPTVGTAALPSALQALGAATGHAVDAAELAKAAALPDELQQALARIVLAYLQAARDYAAATNGLSRADLAALARGEPPSVQPDAGRMASAALLLDRAVRESAPALRKWGLLLEAEERTTHPRLSDVTPDALLRAGGSVDSLRDAADLAAVLQGFLPTQARFTPTSSTPSASFQALYRALGVPPLHSDAAAFQLLDAQPAPLQALAMTLGDGLLQATQALHAAEGIVSPSEIEAAYADLEAMDLAALRAAPAEGLDLSRLQRAVEVLERADRALVLRLQGAAVLAGALEQAQALAPAVAALPLPGADPSTQSHYPATLPPLNLAGVPGLGDCTLGESSQGSTNGAFYVHCGATGNTTLPNGKVFYDERNLQLSLFADHDGDGAPDETELLLRTPALADYGNNIRLKDPYGFLLVGDIGSSVFDQRYGNINVSLRMENGTVIEERRALYEGQAAPHVATALNLMAPFADLNYTLFEPQQNGVLNFTLNPENHTLLSVDLGGDDLYTMRPGGSANELRVYNSSFQDKYGRTFNGLPGSNDDCTPIPLFPVGVLVLGQCENDFTINGAPVTGNQLLLLGRTYNDPESEGGVTYVNMSNASQPIRLGVALDTSGNDRYESLLNYTLGAADRGVGLFWDAERCHPTKSAAVRQQCTNTPPGDDRYFGTFYSQGAGTFRGVGLFLDEHGDDVHVALNVSLGAGSDRGVGLALDLDGKDRWFGGNFTMGFGGRADTPCPLEGTVCASEPSVVGLNTEALSGNRDSFASRPGLGVLLDRQGDDVYDQVNRTANQGKGWPALGLLLDLGGDDRGLQTNLTARGDFGNVALGFQHVSFLATTGATTGLGETSWSFYNGTGGGLVVDAQLTDLSTVEGLSGAPSRGFGMGATEVGGDTNSVLCSRAGQVQTALAPPDSEKCKRNDDLEGPRDCTPNCATEGETLEWTQLSRQKFLLRIPGAFGLGGTLSNDGLESFAHTEEHLLQFDLGGNDVYRGPFAGAAVPNLTAFDTDGSRGSDGQNGQPATPDRPVNMTPLFQGGLLAPVSVTIDASGSDLYDGRTGLLGGARRNLTTPSLGGAWMGLALLHDLGPAPLAGGFPALQAAPEGCDRHGLNDAYVGFNRTLGYGGLYGIGVLADTAGDDCYVTLTGDSGAPATEPAYALGVGRLGGLGVLLDPRGNDTYLGGNFTQGVGILEPTNDHLPQRVGVGNANNCVSFHDTTGCLGNPTVARTFASAAQAFGALVDARGHDQYTFGQRSQGYGERRFPPETDTAPQGSLPPRRAVAGLFVDDGFERDTYTNATWAPVGQGHRDNSFWCDEETQRGPLHPNLASLDGLPRVAETLAGTPAGPGLAPVLPTVARLEGEGDRARTTARDGPNAAATCLRLELDTGQARGVDLGALGRGFDNLDFFANFLLAVGTFGEEYVRARSVLSAPAVAALSCMPLNHTGFPTEHCGARLNSRVQVNATVLWGPASFLYNANQLLRLLCARATGNDTACNDLVTGRPTSDQCRAVVSDPAAGDALCTPKACGTEGCSDNPTLGLNLTADNLALNNTKGLQDATGLPGIGNAVRRLEFRLRAPGSDEADDVLLGVYDGREGLACAPGFPDPCPLNVTTVDAEGNFSLRWDTLHLVADADGLPALQSPDGRYDLVAKAYFQADQVNLSGVVLDERLRPGGDDQRYALNRLGDEYGYYPGVAVERVVVDNAPVVYQLQYEDVSLADDPLFPPNHELRLNLTVSPRRADDPEEALTFGGPYVVDAVVQRADDRSVVLPRRVVACDEGDDVLQDTDLNLASCAHEARSPTAGTSPRQRIVVGWPEQDVRSALQDGDYLLRVDVTEPHPTLGVRSTVACFTRHGLSLQPSAFVEETGQAERSTSTPNRNLTARDAAWTPDQWTGFRVRLTGGLGAGQERVVVGNSEVNLTVDVPWQTRPDATTTFALVNAVCKDPLAVDSVKPVVRAVLDPSRLGADGVRYVNRSVAFPDPGRALLQGLEATIPVRFVVDNAAEKRSPVLSYELRANRRELPTPGLPEGAADTILASTYLTDRGNFTVPVCGNSDPDNPDPEEHPCLMRQVPPVEANPEDVERFLNESLTRLLLEVQAGGRDLAGNVDPPVLDDAGFVVNAEDAAILDVDAPESKLCQPVSTGRAGVPATIPRIRTSDRVLPLPWVATVAGCQGGITPRDNHGVEAVVVGYDVADPDAFLLPQDLERRWQPPRPEQVLGRASFHFDARGLAEELGNNRTLNYMSVARDFAGNEQTSNLQVWKTTFDDRAPDVAVLNLTADHTSITYRWFARDREAGGRVENATVEWGVANATTGLPELSRRTAAVVGGSDARAVLEGLEQNTTYYLRAVTTDDVGNTIALPVQAFATDPIARLELSSPLPGDVLTGSVPVRFNVSDVRVDPVLHYNVSLVLVTGNDTLVLEVENFTRRECFPGEAECPLANSTITVVRNLASAKFPDSREAYLRLAVTNLANPHNPLVVSVGPLKLDNGPPATGLRVVAEGGPVWYRTAALLLLEPRDNITDVVHTEWSFDNFTYQPYNASAPPMQDREGSLPFFFRSVDRAGNVEELRQVDLRIDKQRPLGNLSLNGGARATSDPNVTLTLQATDGLSGLANITVDTGDAVEVLERPTRFGTARNLPLTLPAGEGERRVRVRLTDQAGNVQELKSSLLVDTSPPTLTEARVERVGHTSASLSWRTSELSSTRLEYGPATALVLANRFQGNDTTLAHIVGLQGLRPSLTYQYRLVATDELGNRATLRGTFETLPDVTPPGAARSLAAEDLGQGAVKLTWEAAFDDVGVDHYIVLRGVRGQLDELGRASELAFVDDRGLPGVTYDYAVQAVDLAGQPGPRSALASARASTRPVLLDGAVSPDKGTATTVYTYRVTLRDPDGDSPSVVRVRVSGHAFEMKPTFEGRADFAQGVLYTFATRLPATTLSGGFPSYQFEAADGRGLVQHPDVPAAGPAVLAPGAILPGLSAATGIFGLPGFEVLAAAAAVGIALLIARVKRGRWGR